MTPKDQRLAIAKFCGWVWDENSITRLPDSHWARYSPSGEDQLFVVIPDYHEDLNAMHEAEQKLNELPYLKGWGLYINRLIDVTQNHSVEGKGLIHATAPQRAEAMLRVIEK